ncbi:tubulin monoglycylase TTLL3 isoform X2 [Scleropages formosus]|uniref:tubulin monoglycylase TTLL3 isoform X2 n=1 Tax=Scleropages formosus TaxID=113540 RepID=UPI000878A925|nr:tubulin monoglycylase TTLL3-like isoform X2 [Scleropages formosus]
MEDPVPESDYRAERDEAERLPGDLTPQSRGDPQRENPNPAPSRRNTHTPSASQPESALPADGRIRRSFFNLPVINPDRLRTAKALVDKAVKLKKVFSVQGPYPVVRAALRARGWVERYLPRPTPQIRHPHGDDDDDGDNRDDSDDNDDSAEEVEKQDGSDNLYDLMSRLVRNESTYLYWTMRRDAIDCRTLRKEQMINHYAKAGTFTTKVGLCVNLRNLQWFDAADPDTFFPRCYRLGAEDEKHAFIEDFRRTACNSLLQYVVERHYRQQREGEVARVKVTGPSHSQGQKKQNKRRAMQMVGSGMIDTALQVCQDFLDCLDHHDIDIAKETSSSLTEQQWAEFLHNYYLVVHDGVEMEDSAWYVDRCHTMLQRLQAVCPQLDTDGIHNIWIVKPGAKSRGRGILCFNRLHDILKLVDSDPSLIKDSKWVVQKYLERPFLIHGTKFDVRQWFLVTDWNPLTVWFYRECYLRFSTQPYSLETLDSSIHLCNNSIQKHFQPSELRHPEVPEDNMWSCEQFCSFLSKQGREAQWRDIVVPGMQQAVVHALQTAQDLVESRRGSFELYGADFMLGRDLRPWLIEINASPTMAPSTAVTARLCAAVQEDTLRVVLDRRLDRNASTGGFELIYKQPAVEVPQYVGVNLLVEGASLRRPRLASQRRNTFLQEHEADAQPRPSQLGQEAAAKTAKSAVRKPRATAEKQVQLRPTISYNKTPAATIFHSTENENHTESERKGLAPVRRRNPVVLGRPFSLSPLRVPRKVTADRSGLRVEPRNPRRLGFTRATAVHLPQYNLSRSLDTAWNTYRSHIPHRLTQPTLKPLLRAPRDLPALQGPILPLKVISLQLSLLNNTHTIPHTAHVSNPGLQMRQFLSPKQAVTPCKEGGHKSS